MVEHNKLSDRESDQHRPDGTVMVVVSICRFVVPPAPGYSFIAGMVAGSNWGLVPIRRFHWHGRGSLRPN
jgi:hypothetical protein